MAKEKRTQDRAKRREDSSEKVKVWNVSLISKTTAIKDIASREWNFDTFYEKVKRIAPFVSREELHEFMGSHGISLKNKPKPSGRMV